MQRQANKQHRVQFRWCKISSSSTKTRQVHSIQQHHHKHSSWAQPNSFYDTPNEAMNQEDTDNSMHWQEQQLMPDFSTASTPPTATTAILSSTENHKNGSTIAIVQLVSASLLRPLATATIKCQHTKQKSHYAWSRCTQLNAALQWQRTDYRNHIQWQLCSMRICTAQT